MKSLKSIAMICLLALGAMQAAYADIENPKRTQGLAVSPGLGDHSLVTLKGPGKFVSAQVTKQGGYNDLTFVSLDVDGVNVVNVSIAALKNWGLTANNPYGLVLLSSGNNLETLTIGFQEPLIYNRSLELSVTVNESGVAQIVGNVIHTTTPTIKAVTQLKQLR